MLWPALMLSYYSFMRAHEFATLNSHGQTLQIKFLISHNSQRCNPFTQLQCISQIHLPTLLELLISILLQSHHEFGLIFHGGRFSSYMAAAHISTSLTAATKYSQKHYTSHSYRIDVAITVAATGLLAWLIKTLGRWSSEAYQLITATSLQLKPSQLARSCNYQQSP